MAAEDGMYLDNIDEYLNDENKLVTYKWLSYNLGIHVNKSKSLLEEYLNNHNDQVDVVYVVGGLTGIADYQKYEFKLYKKDQLERAKLIYDPVTCCHVYALQKVPIKDSNMLYSVDVDIVKNSAADVNKWSAIQCEASNQRRSIPTSQNPGNLKDITSTKKAEINLPQEKKATPVPVVTTQKQSSTTKAKENVPASFFGKKTINEKKVKMESAPTSKSVIPKTTATKKSDTSPGSSALSKAFSRVPAKSDVKKSNAETISVQVSESVSEKNNSDARRKVLNKKENYSEDVDNGIKVASQKRKAESDSEDEEGFEKFLSKAKDPILEKSRKPPKKEPAKPKNDKTDVDVDVVAATPEPAKKPKSKIKRRKKEESNDKEMEEDSIPSSEGTIVPSSMESKESTNPTPVYVESSDSVKRKRRGRRRVLKSKQFMNDEGFMVTEKVYESESYSEESDTETTKSKPPMKMLEKSEVASKKPKQQASLMSFFKKK